MTEHVFSLTDMQRAIQRVMAGGHSVFSPSGSPMWMGCSGSLIPNLFAEDDAGEDAAYGTVGHAMGEMWLKTGVRPTHMIDTQHIIYAGDWGYLITVDDDMLNHVERYVNWVKYLPGEHFVETRVDFSVLTPIPNQGGTADHVVCVPRRMIITDLKMGKGVHVVAKDNSQALLYAVGFFLEWDWFYDFQEFEIRIAQPRRDNMDVWVVDRKFLLAFMAKVKVRAAAAWIQNAPRTPSSKACQWCKVASTCAAYAKFLCDMTEGVFDDLGSEVTADEMAAVKDRLDNDQPPVVANMSDLTTAQLGKLLQWRPSIERYFKRVDEELFRRSQAGDTSKLWYIAQGRSHRVIPDKNRKQYGLALIAAGVPKAKVFIEEVPSPAEAERLLAKAGMKGEEAAEYITPYIFKPPGKATLVPFGDKRPPLADITEGVFGDLT